MDNFQKTFIHLDDPLVIRLASYADSKGKKSLAETIEHLLDKVNQDNKSPTSQPPIDEDVNGGNGDTFYHRPIVEYFANDSTRISEENFKRELLKTKRAKRVILFYHNKPNEESVWRANKFTENSNVKRNLDTGPLRDWHQKGIEKILLYILSR